MKVKFWSPSTSVRATWLPPKKSPLEVTPTLMRRPALEVQPLEEPLAALVLGHHLVGDVGLEVDEALGGGLHLLLHLLHRLRGVAGVQLVLALEVADEGEPVAARPS